MVAKVGMQHLSEAFHFVPLTVEVSILSLLFPIWPLDRIPDFHLGSVCGESFHFTHL